MSRKRRVYPPEFRHKVLELIRAGRNQTEVARELEISRQTVTNWMRHEDLGGGRRSDGLTVVEHDEVMKLRKRVRQLEIEREILSKAAAWFARETDAIPSKSSNS